MNIPSIAINKKINKIIKVIKKLLIKVTITESFIIINLFFFYCREALKKEGLSNPP